MSPEQFAARQEANALMAAHSDTIGAAVFIFGAEATASILRALADMIEAGEFNRERMH